MNTQRLYLLITLLLSAYIIPVKAAKEAKAKQYLDRFSQVVAHSGGVSLGFTLTMSRGSSIIQKSSGTLSMNGSQYYMQSSGLQIWFDGTTQWNYVEATNEVNISTPTKQEAQMINPLILARSYEKGFNYRTLPIKSLNQKPCVSIELTAVAQSELDRILLYLDPQSSQPLMLELYTDNKEVKTQIFIRGFKSHLTLPKENFTFQSTKFPNIEIIDLR